LKTREMGAALLVMSLAVPMLGWAQAGDGKAQLERVQVQGEASAQALRRASVGALVVLGREELLRHGDTRLTDALQRMPGLSVVNGNGPRGAEIRMSGLGGGYTQVLLNGEPVPPGFSLESLSPELVERVEVSRAASVEQSNQAIAGSVNIILRRVPRSAQRELKLGLASQFDRPSASADLQLGDRAGALAWGLGLGASSDKLVWPMALQQQVRDAQGQLTQAYSTDKREFDHSYRLTLAPRASWTLAPSESLGTDHLLRLFRARGGALDRRSSEFGPPPQQSRNDLLIAAHGYSLRSRFNWQRKQEDDGQQWELKLGFTRNQRDSHADFDGYDFDGRWIRDAEVLSLAVDQGLSLAGRWRRPAGEGGAHQLSLGWDGEQSQRDEDRLQREQSLPGGLPVENLDEVYRARVRRLAVFVQDEWELSPQWQATLGLRWEGLHQRSEGNVFEGVRSRASVVSPVAQLLWKLPASRDQLRMGLARSYKAPTPRELMPRRFVANNNSPTTPDLQGNPNLKPELAWSLDLGWSHPLGATGKAGQLAVNAYAKRIENVVVEDLLQAANGAWVQTRANRGQAEVQGVELDARVALQQLWPAGPALDLRGNLAINRSRVAAVPGPDNRLAQQTPLSLNLGLDHRVAGTVLSWGGNLNLQAGGPQRQSETRFIDLPSKRLLDLYALWKEPAGGGQWRASLSNLLHADELTQRSVLVQGSEHRLDDRWRSGATVRLQYERPL